MVSPADETPVTPHDAWPEELDIAFAAHYLAECTTLEISHVAHSWAGLRTFAPDRAPLIGYDNAAEGVFWLAGLGGFGIQTSPAVGQLAAAILTQSPLRSAKRGSAFKSEQVSPDRFR
ncbi:FAD-dependent oxidoreductase [Phaeobacter gallaeciensis]|uniref:FAD-dependent oxidoreductase n=1 Tax=Phaeobacter gallaeciensis TaxID=60890 RepID=UPI003CD020E7